MKSNHQLSEAKMHKNSSIEKNWTGRPADQSAAVCDRITSHLTRRLCLPLWGGEPSPTRRVPWRLNPGAFPPPPVFKILDPPLVS